MPFEAKAGRVVYETCCDTMAAQILQGMRVPGDFMDEQPKPQKLVKEIAETQADNSETTSPEDESAHAVLQVVADDDEGGLTR